MIYLPFNYLQAFAGLLSCVSISKDRKDLYLKQLLVVLVSAIFLGTRAARTHTHNLLSQICDSANLEGEVPMIASPRNKVVILHPKT
jgi:hypothetical protein